MTAGVPFILEPMGLDCGDGKRLRTDGLSVFPLSHDKNLCSDATVTFCRTVLTSTAHTPANHIEEREVQWYSNIANQYRLTPNAMETTGVYGKQTRVR